MLARIMAEIDPEEMPALAELRPQLAAAREQLRYEDGIAAVIDGLLT
jgi:hypothetical protein